MGKWLIKHPRYLPGRLVGEFERHGVLYYKVAWTKFSKGKYYDARPDVLEKDLLASSCIKYKLPPKWVRRLKSWWEWKKENIFYRFKKKSDIVA